VNKKYSFSIFVAILFTHCVFADTLKNSPIEIATGTSPLVLSNAQMKKLQHYFPVQNTNHLIWNGDPLKISLPIGKEKRIVFPSYVTVSTNGKLTNKQLNILADNNSLYVTAMKAFSPTRFYVTLPNIKSVLLVDFSTDTEAMSNTTIITVTQNINNETSSEGGVTTFDSPSKNSASDLISTSSVINDFSSHSQTVSDETNTPVTSVSLVRYAWQSLFSPKRLIKPLQGISRAPMETTPFLSSLVYGDKVIAHPEASWQDEGFYVTAIELRNKYPHATTIHLSRDICGNWKAAAIYPSFFLKARMQKKWGSDSATLFLVSTKPFGESMAVCHGNA
jgi:integrating conjugative element protein (TIGR03749 family)